MPRRATGNSYLSRGVWYARVTVGPKKRRSFALAATDEASADVRASLLARLASRLRAAGCAEAEQLLEIAAAAAEGKALVDVERAVELVCTRQSRAKTSAETTYREVAARWTTGDLAREYPARVKAKGTTRSDQSYLEHHILPVTVESGGRLMAFGDLPIGEVGIDQAETVLAALPSTLEQSTRRNVAQCLRRVLVLAAFPLRLIPINPLPKGWLPDKGPAKAKGYLYPDEDATLLGCTSIPLCWRMLWGFLNREGPRIGEAIRFTLSDVDLQRGGITLEKNKTNDPRSWPLLPSDVRAVKLWLAYREVRGEHLGPESPLFVSQEGVAILPGAKHSRRLRLYLEEAGIDRPALHTTTAERRALRCHDTRATFITIALANGKTETWVADRTGHKSSTMINLYRRGARTVAELGLGELAPLDEAIPELATLAGKGARKGGAPGATRANVANERRSMNGGHISPPDVAAANAGDPKGKGAASDPRRATSKGGGALSGPSAALSRGPREGLLVDLVGRLREAVEAGDLGAARVAHEAIGKLLGAAGEGAVIDLAKRRRR